MAIRRFVKATNSYSVDSVSKCAYVMSCTSNVRSHSVSIPYVCCVLRVHQTCYL